MKKHSSLAAAAVLSAFSAFAQSNPDGSISGAIHMPNGAPLRGTTVTLSGAAASETLSDNQGRYAFDDLPTGQQYVIAPTQGPLNDPSHPLSGLSTFDLILFHQHILGTYSVQNPYTLLALDLNVSSSITVLDILLLRRRIFAIEMEIFNQPNVWYFIPADYVFPVPSNPWFETFPQSITIDDLPHDSLFQQDFIAVERGNLCHCPPYWLAEPELEVRHMPGHALSLRVEDRQIAPGERFTVEFRSDDLAQMVGFQFVLGFDPADLTLAGIEYHLLREQDFGTTYAAEGKLYALWYDPAPDAALPTGEVLFRLHFEAGRGGQLRDMLRFEAGPLKAEAYDRELNRYRLSLRFEEPPAPRFELYPNAPNPVHDYTNISFFLPEPCEVRLSISDAQGRVLKVLKPGILEQGFNTVPIPTADLPAGVLFYTLNAGNYAATGKMLVVK